MQLQEYRGKSLDYLVIYPHEYNPAQRYPLIILLHGFGANMYDLADLSLAIDLRGYLYACPNGPVPMEIGPGMVGYGWTPPGEFRSPEHIQQAQARLEAFFHEVMEHLPVLPGRVVLAGFSQGGSLCYRCGLPRPKAFAGLAALSCSLPEESEVKPILPPAQRDQAIFIAHGRQDPVVPVDRGRQARAFLETEGYRPTYHEYDMGHEITPILVADLARWIHTAAPPLS